MEFTSGSYTLYVKETGSYVMDCLLDWYEGEDVARLLKSPDADVRAMATEACAALGL